MVQLQFQEALAMPVSRALSESATPTCGSLVSSMGPVWKEFLALSQGTSNNVDMESSAEGCSLSFFQGSRMLLVLLFHWSSPMLWGDCVCSPSLWQLRYCVL